MANALPCPLLHHADTRLTGAPLSVHPQPSATTAAGVLAGMDLSSGRPTCAWWDIHTLRQRHSTLVYPLALPNTHTGGRLVLAFRTPNADHAIVVLLARTPALTVGDLPGQVFTSYPDVPIVFSPHVYRLHLPRPGTFAHENAHLNWTDLPGPHTPDAYQTLIEAAERALQEAEDLPPVVAPHYARPGALVAPWALGGRIPTGVPDILIAAARPLVGTTSFGSIMLTGGVMDDTGNCTPLGVHWEADHMSGSTIASRLSSLTAWFAGRVAAPGCPWPAHTMIAQAMPRQSKGLLPAQGRTGAVLLTLDCDQIRAPVSAHERMRQHQIYAQTMAW